MVIERGPTHSTATVIVDDVSYSLIVHDAEEGGYWTEVSGMPGCFSQGDTLDALEANVRDAIRCWLEFQ